MKINFAIITFPGLNREKEALIALERNKMRGEIFLWNENPKKLAKFDGFIIPGGFSYEDRVRAGVIAAKDRLMETLRKFSEQNNKVLLGICNGAQILIESGIVPFDTKTPTFALARNRRIKNNQVLGTGFYNTWIFVKNSAPEKKTAFNLFPEDKILHIPIAHAEGRFLADESTIEKIIGNKQNTFSYCTEQGEIKSDFPVNPNGAIKNLAGITNIAGNAMSFMPHPETFPSGDAIFQSIQTWFTGKIYKSIKTQNNSLFSSKQTSKKIIVSKSNASIQKDNLSFEITAELIITDNEAISAQNCLRDLGFKNIILQKKVWWKITPEQTKTISELQQKEIAEKIVRSGEILNLEKENATLKIAKQEYSFSKTQGWITSLVSKKETTNPTWLVQEKEDFVGQAKKTNLTHRLKDLKIKEVQHGILWEIKNTTKAEQEKILALNFFANPNSANLIKLF